MRRKAASNLPQERGRDVRENLTPGQLQAIGAAIVAWNEAERFIPVILGQAIGMSIKHYQEVSSRINGLEGQVEIIRKFQVLYPLIDKETGLLIENALASFLGYKKCRDAIAHAHIFNAPKGIGTHVKRRAEEWHVLLTEEALNKFYDHLVLLRSELAGVTGIFMTASITARKMEELPNRKVPNKIHESIQVFVRHLQKYQSERQALGSLPSCPDLSIPFPNIEELDSLVKD